MWKKILPLTTELKLSPVDCGLHSKKPGFRGSFTHPATMAFLLTSIQAPTCLVDDQKYTATGPRGPGMIVTGVSKMSVRISSRKSSSGLPEAATCPFFMAMIVLA